MGHGNNCAILDHIATITIRWHSEHNPLAVFRLYNLYHMME